MNAVDTLLGYPIPFPKQDLYVALIAVCSFLPLVVIVHNLIVKTGSLVTKAKIQ